MKKVLIITYHFPPRPTIGSSRIKALADYLPAHGWDPIILTPVYAGNFPNDYSYDNYNVVRTEYSEVALSLMKLLKINPKKSIKKQVNDRLKNSNSKINSKYKRLLLSFLRKIFEEFVAFPDLQIGWYDHGLKAGSNILCTEKIDAIISSSKPETCHLIASDLCKRYKIPWLADFRDLWTQNHYYSNSFLRRTRERKLELSTMRLANTLTTVSSPLVEKLKEIHTQKHIYSIPNGFDPQEMISHNVETSKKFTITYTGSYYEGKRDPTILFRAINDLISESLLCPEDILIRFFGPSEEWLQNKIELYNLQKIAFQYGPVTRLIALEKQRESQLLLLLLWNHPEEVGVYTGKVFEYLAAQRPILSIGGPVKGAVSELLEDTDAGYYVCSLEDLKSTIVKCYEEYKFNGYIPYKGKKEVIEKYSQREMVNKFATILDKLVFIQPSDN